MVKTFRRPLGLALGALATTSLGGCYYGDVNSYGTTYASNDCAVRYGNAYYDVDPYAYDDGYGYDCYDSSDYGSGFVQIGFGGGWYDNYYYPGYGLWLFDSYRNRYPLRGQYLNYWGGRRAWWQHHGRRGDGQWNGGGRHNGRPRGDGRTDRPGGWDGRDHDGDNPRGARPGRRPGDGDGSNNPPTTTNPGRPGGWRDRDGDRPRGTRPDRRPQHGDSRPAARQPLPTVQVAPAPAVRSVPRPPVSAAPSRPAPVARPTRDIAPREYREGGPQED